MRYTIPLVALAVAAVAAALPTEKHQPISNNGTSTDLMSTNKFSKREDFDPEGEATACEITYENWWKAVFTEHRVRMKNCQDKSGNPYENLFDKLEDMLPSSISVTGYNWVLSRGPDTYWIHFNSIVGQSITVCRTLKKVSEKAWLSCIDR